MKKSELIGLLAEAYPGPDPARKRAFLRAAPVPPVSHASFMLSQAGYVGKAVWAVSAAVFVLALAASRLIPAEGIWIGAALTPFAAMAAVSEQGRAVLYGMEELELASRFGRKSVVLARMGAVGLVHLGALLALALLGGGDALRRGIYLLVPYLLTDLLCLEAVRRVRGRESLYVCAGAAVLTAGLAAAMSQHRGAYDPVNFHWWLLALAAAAVLTGRAYARTVRKMEELSWN